MDILSCIGNATAHNALSVKQFLASKRMPVLAYSPYSPNVALCNSDLSPKVKSALMETDLPAVDEVKKKAAVPLKGLTLLALFSTNKNLYATV